MCVEVAVGTQTVEGLPRGDQVLLFNADAYVLLLPLHVVGGGHAGAICLTDIA